MTDPEQRPSLNDLAADAQPATGLECPSCGCGHFYVRKTIKADGMIVRRRECRHCGKRITTFEGS